MYIGELLVIALLILGTVSFALFLRRLLFYKDVRTQNDMELNEKLDRIIELLEEDKKK
ncbi:DUF4083 family protein [Cytobacillus sp. Hz8]|uniref:DUF4083 family protein n=1 Tax=Cytobacillus sp. Hz8 TaxID=3347168 RepID=UPI0035DCE43C